MLTEDQLEKIMPTLSAVKRRQYLPLLNAAMREGGIDTYHEATAFLAQLAHESVSLRYFEEIASGQAYEGRRDLGNTQPGDGRRYKGRGPIQLTGRNNYRKAGQALKLPLEANPELAEDPAIGFRVAVWFWTSRGLNTLARQGTVTSFRAITRRVNGGYNGWADRLRYWQRARKVLPVDWRLESEGEQEQPVKVRVKGQELPGFEHAGSAHVPVRATAALLGYDVRPLDVPTSRVEVLKGTVSVSIFPVVVRDGTAYCRAREFERLGCVVTWDGGTRVVEITG